MKSSACEKGRKEVETMLGFLVRTSKDSNPNPPPSVIVHCSIDAILLLICYIIYSFTLFILYTCAIQYCLRHLRLKSERKNSCYFRVMFAEFKMMSIYVCDGTVTVRGTHWTTSLEDNIWWRRDENRHRELICDGASVMVPVTTINHH